MYDYKFSDYIELYKNLNNEDWIILYEENTQRNMENDIFTFCALTDMEYIVNNQYLENYEWGFATDSFGKAGFGTYGTYENGELKEEIFFFDGITHDSFEYLIALRSFEKYDKSVEINPKFIWYGNLVKGKEGYYNPITDELIIKVSEREIVVQREYLKDFLCAYQKVCVVVCDHRRWFNSDDMIKEQYSDIRGKNYCFALNVSTYPEGRIGYKYCASIIGKTVIMPYKKPHHVDYKYFTEEEKYEQFIVDYDEDEDEAVYFTCNEKELANFFGANPEAPHFLTPIYFKIQVLDRYKNDSRNYTITDSTISFLNEWSIPFNINKENIVSVWLGDLGRIPYEEQQYWKAYNIPPKGGMDQKFIDRQLRNKWTDSSRIESKLVPALNKLNAIVSEKYGDVIFKVLSDADKEIYNTFMLPTNYSMPEYQSFLMKLCKLTSESINVSLIKKIMGDEFDESVKGSVLQLGMFLEFIGVDKKRQISTSIKKVQDSRNKLAGHSASLKEYNKVWGREKDEKINSIADARSLLENIISSIEYAKGVYFIYVKVEDNAGNKVVLNSEGIVIYAESTLSPTSIFFSGEDSGNGMTMQTVVREINADYDSRLDEIINNTSHDVLEMSGSRAVWKEVLAVYSVKTTTDPDNPQEVATMDDNKKQLLKDIFWEMNEISSRTESKTETQITESDDGHGNIVETETTVTQTYLYITVSHKTAEEMADKYGFNEEQRQQLSELLAEENNSLWSAVLYGITIGDGEIVTVALSQVGNAGGEPYWSWYGFDGRVEWCACFVSWCADQCGYIDSGVIPKFAGCVNGSQWFKDRGQWQDGSFTPEAGQIIFFDWEGDGETDHVGIVERCENGIVYTVEGNSGDACRQRSYPVGSSSIYGYGIPAY